MASGSEKPDRRFYLKLPETAKQVLAKLPRKHHLELHRSARAGVITTSDLKKGQAKPRLHAKDKAKPKGQA